MPPLALRSRAACVEHARQRLASILEISLEETPATASESQDEVLQSFPRCRKTTTSPSPPKRPRTTSPIPPKRHPAPQEQRPSATTDSATRAHNDGEKKDEDESWKPWKCCKASRKVILTSSAEVQARKQKYFLKNAISPCSATDPPLHTLVYVKYPKNTPHSKKWKQFKWIDNVSVFEDLTRAVASQLLEDWGYRYPQTSIVFKYDLNGELFPISNDFDATIASNSQEETEDVYLRLVSPENAVDPKQC